MQLSVEESKIEMLEQESTTKKEKLKAGTQRENLNI